MANAAEQVKQQIDEANEFYKKLAAEGEADGEVAPPVPAEEDPYEVPVFIKEKVDAPVVDKEPTETRYGKKEYDAVMQQLKRA